MKAHISTAALQTTELEFCGKIYNVAASLSVLDKIERLDDSTSETTSVKKILKWLINDAIERDNMLYGKTDKAITDEAISLLVGKSNLPYYSEVLNEVLGWDPESDTVEVDEDGNEVIITDDMIDEFGEAPEIKNTTAE